VCNPAPREKLNVVSWVVVATLDTGEEVSFEPDYFPEYTTAAINEWLADA
jgi:hypothetical protein